MGLLDHFKGRHAPNRATAQVEPSPARPPAGFLSWVMLTAPAGNRVPAIMRRLVPADGIILARWPQPTYFDWLGLIDGRPSGRPTRATVNYDKPLRLQVAETLALPGAPPEILGAIALCDKPDDRPDALELAYLEKHPDSPLRGFGLAALALALLEAEARGKAFFLDALIKSGSDKFYRSCGMITVDGTPWPTVTVRMEFPDRARASAFLAEVRDRQIIP